VQRRHTNPAIAKPTGVLALQRGGDSRHVGIGLLARDAVLQASEDLGVVVARAAIAAGILLRGRDVRGPHFDRLQPADGKLEPFGHHAGDLPHAVVALLDGAGPAHRERLADDGGVSAEAPAPEAVADERDTMPAGDLAIRAEEPADSRRDAKQRHQVRRNHHRAQRLRLAIREGRKAQALESRQILERRLLRPPVVEVRRGDVAAGQSLPGGIRLVDDHEPIGSLERQAAQSDGIDDRVDGGRGADTERQDDEGDGGESGCRAQGSNGELQVLEHGDFDANGGGGVGAIRPRSAPAGSRGRGSRR
jgi:hypothetical protein